jgi:hypothetical protein
MKNTLKIVALSAVFAFNVQAQEGKEFGEELTFGIKAGANFSNVYDTKGEDFRADGKLGLAAGAFFAIPLGKTIGV